MIPLSSPLVFNNPILNPFFLIVSTPPTFSTNLTFLSVTFEQTLFFKNDLIFLRKNFYNRFYALCSIVSASCGSFKKSFCTLYQWSATFFMTAKILSIKIIEGPAVHLKHTVVVAYAESFRDFVSDFATSSQNNGNL